MLKSLVIQIFFVGLLIAICKVDSFENAVCFGIGTLIAYVILGISDIVEAVNKIKG